MLRPIRAGVLLLALGASVTACGDNPAGPGDLHAEYQLTAINGDEPPQVIFENEEGQLLITEGQTALFERDRYIQQINFTQVLTDTEVRTSRICEGTYTLQGTSLVLEEDDCDKRVYEATLMGDTIIYTFTEGVELTWAILPESPGASTLITSSSR